MAVNELPIPSFTVEGAQQRDKEILASMVGLRKVGGTIASGQVLASGTVLSYNASTKTYSAYTGTDEVQTITRTATGGTASFTFGGETTATVVPDATLTADDIQEAFDALSNVDPGDITVTGSAGGPFTVTFGERYSGVDVPQITTGGSPTGGTVTIATSTAGSESSGQASGVLAKAVNTTSTQVLGEVIVNGTLKLDQLVGLTDSAVRQLNGRVNTALNEFSF